MISIDPRFNGPTDCGHGGVSAGRFAELVNPLAASVRFAAPIPLATELDSEQDGRFRAVPRINFASRAVELAQRRAKDPEPGMQYTVVLDAPVVEDEDEDEA